MDEVRNSSSGEDNFEKVAVGRINLQNSLGI
jgi:hypothetical protein